MTLVPNTLLLIEGSAAGPTPYVQLIFACFLLLVSWGMYRIATSGKDSDHIARFGHS